MTVKTIPILTASDKALLQLSKDNVLSLSLAEMKTIQAYFRGVKRDPTDVELETIAQTWSEHCKHKTLTGTIEFTHDGRRKTYHNLLKETVFRATKELDKPWCISVFKDNAGIIEFDDRNGIAFKVETHNHPSALEPYGGSATGIGGVIRDILGVGLGAKPLANTDVFCFGRPDLPWSRLPKGILHPKRIAKGVVSGVRDYGNRMGIPTVNGGVYFDEGYMANPLVYCGTMGIIPKDKTAKTVAPGDLILVVGGRTGRDGIHGATFSSVELDHDSDVTAVQIGNPIVEKKVMDTLLTARDKGLFRGLTDCGAGGLSSAIGELAEHTGARVHLDRVPLKYAGLKPWEIWVSEAQERMVLSVPPKHREAIAAVFAGENVEATFIGEFTQDHRLTLLFNDAIVAALDMAFLHDGVPKVTKKAVWHSAPPPKAPRPPLVSRDCGKDLKDILSSYNVCSREWIIRQYDHEVQGQTVIKPLHGASLVDTGPGDAAVIWPYTLQETGAQRDYKGIVLSCGLNPAYGKIDPYWMAASAIDEALRNAVAVGGDIDRIAILDNFCWGNPNKPEVLGSLVRAAEACYDMATQFGTPFISGKDSLYNEYTIGDKTYSIPAALLISAIGVVPDIRATVTMDLKAAGNLIYIVGETRNELGGSQYHIVRRRNGGAVPTVDAHTARRAMSRLGTAIRQGLVSACHDCSEGGIAVALAEMAFAGGKGVQCALDTVAVRGSLTPTEILFSESNSRFLVEVRPEVAEEFESALAGSICAAVGTVTDDAVLRITANGADILSENISTLRACWKRTLAW